MAICRTDFSFLLVVGCSLPFAQRLSTGPGHFGPPTNMAALIPQSQQGRLQQDGHHSLMTCDHKTTHTITNPITFSISYWLEASYSPKHTQGEGRTQGCEHQEVGIKGQPHKPVREAVLGGTVSRAAWKSNTSFLPMHQISPGG